MNIKDMVFPVGLAFVTIFTLNYFFPSNTNTQETETSFVAPKERREYKPLNVEVDFVDQKRTSQAHVTVIDTAWSTLSFSSDGASLESADFKRELDGQTKTIRTVFPTTDVERENKCFLVALEENTPFYYALL